MIRTKYIMLAGFLLSGTDVLSQQEAIDPPAAVAKVRVYTSLSEALRQPDSVLILDLSRKKLKEVPAEIVRLKNLQELNLSKNKLKALPPHIGQLTSLVTLKASNNDLTSLPPEIGGLQSLKHLELNRNLIVTLPPEIGQLENLESLELWDNEIDSLPDTMTKLKKLQVLELRGILFTEEEQQSIRKMIPECRVYFSPSCLCHD
jgi:Leucine-rich repeat (LRR) protein